MSVVELKLGQVGDYRVNLDGVDISYLVRAVHVTAVVGELTRVVLELLPRETKIVVEGAVVSIEEDDDGKL